MIGNSDLFGPSVAAASTMVKPEPGRDNITELECHNSLRARRAVFAIINASR